MDTSLAWAAGFLDGEGTLTIKRYRRWKGLDFLYYIPQISCAQVNKPLNRVAIKKLKSLFGGYIYHYEVKLEKRGNRLDVIQWGVTSLAARKCLPLILPFLVIKKPQAKLLLKFWEVHKGNRQGHKLTSRDREIRKKFFDKMRTLNVKGKLRLQRLNEKT